MMYKFRYPGLPAVAKSLAAMLLSGFLAATVHAQDMIRHGPLSIAQPWTRATPPRAPGGAYLTITNGGSESDRLVSVASPRAAKAEIHEMKMDNGVMTMRPLADGVEIPAGATVMLAPGGLHIMLMRLSGPIRTGEAIPIVLRFERAGEISVEFTAAPIGAKEPPEQSGGGG